MSESTSLWPEFWRGLFRIGRFVAVVFGAALLLGWAGMTHEWPGKTYWLRGVSDAVLMPGIWKYFATGLLTLVSLLLATVVLAILGLAFVLMCCIEGKD